MAKHQMKLDWYAKRPVEVEKMTHEQFVHAVAGLGVGLLKEQSDKEQAARTKLTYGAGMAGLRGVTYFDRWLNDKDEQAHFVEICAHGEESPIQLAGTTLHELGHVVAGRRAGHGKDWHAASSRLGLRAIRAAGTHYSMAMFAPSIRSEVAALVVRLNDGRPSTAGKGIITPRPCQMGIGTRGGKSRGVGSGSRLRKWVCACEKPVIARVASDEFDATCNACHSLFTQVIKED